MGGIIFWEFDKRSQQAVALTHTTGTIRIQVPDPNQHLRNIAAYGEGPGDPFFSGVPTDLPDTDWASLVQGRMA